MTYFMLIWLTAKSSGNPRYNFNFNPRILNEKWHFLISEKGARHFPLSAVTLGPTATTVLLRRVPGKRNAVVVGPCVGRTAEKSEPAETENKLKVWQSAANNA